VFESLQVEGEHECCPKNFLFDEEYLLCFSFLLSQVKSLPQSGYMPLPSRTRSAVAGASFLSLGSPRLTKWTIQDAGYDLNAKVALIDE